VIYEKLKTVNGFPAKIESLVEFRPAGENVMRISRIAGVVTFAIGDSVYRGACSPRSKQVFWKLNRVYKKSQPWRDATWGGLTGFDSGG